MNHPPKMLFKKPLSLSQLSVDDLVQRISDYARGARPLQCWNQRTFDFIFDNHFYRNVTGIGQARNCRTLLGR